MIRRLSFLLGTLLAASLLAAPATVLGARPDHEVGRRFPGRTVTLRAGTDAFTGRSAFAERSVAALSDTPTADIRVTYSGFTAQAQAVFEAAVGVWERTIVSSQPIHVDAEWTPLGVGVLGQAGPRYLYLFDDGYLYPSALADAICSCEVESSYEIGTSFNSSFSSWYLGTDGNVPSNKYDLFTVVLHELGHGLGFMSSFEVGGSYGYWGYWVYDDIYPLKFDSFEMSAATGGNALINEAVYPNDSTSLKTQLTDGSVYFAGPNTVAAAGGRARLYAPATWNAGSSNSHLNEASYAPGTPDALMTPYLDFGEPIHAPGPITVAILEDIGWTIASPGSGGSGPANDSFSSATQIATLPFEDANVDNVDATLDAGEVQPSCNDAEATVWYKLQPTSNYSVKFRAIPTTAVDLVMAVYEGTSLNALTQRACADNGYPGEEESSTVNVLSGHTYYIQVGGWAVSDTYGEFMFRAKRLTTSLANDNFANASAVALNSVSTANTTGATLQSGEPSAPCAPSIGKTAWYRYTPGRTRTVVANTVGSNFDTVLAVYAGTDLAALTPIACNDDRAGDNRSKVKFTVYGGTTYYFQVGGYNGAGGSLTFRLKRP